MMSTITNYIFKSDDIGIDLSAHLTNTCLQDGTRDGAVRLFSDLSTSQQGSDSCTSLPTGWTTSVFKQICDITGSLFTKAAIAQPTNFQPLPNAFEVFGLDFLVDDVAEAWLLEVNAFPDFKQSGEVGGIVVEGLWEKTMDLVAAEFFGVKEEAKTDKKGELVLVGEVDLKRA
jgi:tubulin--tyrosine ligase